MNDSERIYVSPKVALNRINRILKRCPHGLANITRNEYKEDREGIPAALLLFALHEMDGRFRWFQPGEHIQTDFDVAIISQIDENDPTFDPTITYCQITEFESHTKRFIDVVMRKLKPGCDGCGIHLIVSVRDQPGWTFLPQELADEVAGLEPTYESVWLVCEDGNNSFDYHVIRLWPSPFQTRFNVLSAFDADWFPDFVRMAPRFMKIVEAEPEEYWPELPACRDCGVR